MRKREVKERWVDKSKLICFREIEGGMENVHTRSY
jgi:hypothetical protein